MLAPKKVQLAIASGVSFVCAMCVRYHEGKDKNLDKCTAKDNCGSPIIGDTFHEYSGPLREFLNFCFVCGEAPSAAVEVHGHLRRIGVCERHVHFVSQLAPRSGPHLPISVREVHADEGSTLAEDIPEAARPKTLGNLLADVEAGTFKPDV